MTIINVYEYDSSELCRLATANRNFDTGLAYLKIEQSNVEFQKMDRGRS